MPEMMINDRVINLDRYLWMEKIDKAVRIFFDGSTYLDIPLKPYGQALYDARCAVADTTVNAKVAADAAAAKA